ncbi:MAG: hypothetical protein ACRDT6_06775 [Micromonosporaceae bacterium]
MTGYVLDDLVLAAGFAGAERHRREVSRLLHDAVDGGPGVSVPALCLAHIAVTRPAVADHLAEIIVAAPQDSVKVCGLSRGERLERLRDDVPALDWRATHAAVEAIITEWPVLTTDPRRYAGVPIDVLSL